MIFINTTPHAVTLNDGRVFDANPIAVRNEQFHGEIINDICQSSFGDVVGLPEPQVGVTYIVSLPTLLMIGNLRNDVVAPATNHPNTVRNEKGHTVSVPCFIRLN